MEATKLTATTALEDADNLIARLEGLGGIMGKLALVEADKAAGEGSEAAFYAFMERQLMQASKDATALYARMRAEGERGRREGARRLSFAVTGD